MSLDVEKIRAEVPFTHLDYVASTGSTNADLLKGPPSHFQVLLAGEQTAGRGRLGRSWQSPAGEQLILSLSVLVKDPAHLGLLPLMSGLAITDAIESSTLKWPNDVLLGGRKVAGILSEAQEIEGGYQAVVGIGINTSMTEFPTDWATSLKAEDIAYEETELTISILRALHRRIAQWLVATPEAVTELMDEYRRVSSSIGKTVRVETFGETVEGQVDTINDEGLLVVEGQEFSSGDVTHLR